MGSPPRALPAQHLCAPHSLSKPRGARLGSMLTAPGCRAGPKDKPCGRRQCGRGTGVLSSCVVSCPRRRRLPEQGGARGAWARPAPRCCLPRNVLTAPGAERGRGRGGWSCPSPWGWEAAWGPRAVSTPAAPSIRASPRSSLGTGPPCHGGGHATSLTGLRGKAVRAEVPYSAPAALPALPGEALAGYRAQASSARTTPPHFSQLGLETRCPPLL